MIESWIRKVRYYIEWGHRALWYIRMVMEGEILMAIGEWHDIRELLTIILTGVHVLEDKLKQLK